MSHPPDTEAVAIIDGVPGLDDLYLLRAADFLDRWTYNRYILYFRVRNEKIYDVLAHSVALELDNVAMAPCLATFSNYLIGILYV